MHPATPAKQTALALNEDARIQAVQRGTALGAGA